MISGLETRSEPYPIATPVFSPGSAPSSCRTVRNALDGRLPVELFAVGFLCRPNAEACHAPVPMRRRMAAPRSSHVARALTWDRNLWPSGLLIPYPDST